MAASVLAFVGHAPHVQPSDHDSMRAERERLKHVRASTHTRVVQDSHLCMFTILRPCTTERGRRLTVANCIDDLGQSIQGSYRSVDLSACVVCHDDTLAADLQCLSGICSALDALDQERPSAGDPLPL